MSQTVARFGAVALLALAGCAQQAPAPMPECRANLVLPAQAPAHGVPVEDTPAGRCLAARAKAGDVAAALRLGDFYSAIPGKLPLIDRNGRRVHWYRLAGDHASPTGAWHAVALLDVDHDRQVPNDALAYLITAIKGGIPEAGDYLMDQWEDGRVDPGKLWALRRWLAHPGALPADQARAIIAKLNTPPTDELAPE
jgi:hypothetical protein